LWALSLDRQKLLNAIVRRAVININNLALAPDIAQGSANFINQGTQVLSLVTDGNDNGQLRLDGVNHVLVRFSHLKMDRLIGKHVTDYLSSGFNLAKFFPFAGLIGHYNK